MRHSISLKAVGGLLLASAFIAPASAQNVASWVASSGLDTNTCTRAAPCATFNKALTTTIPGGSIGCVDAGSYLLQPNTTGLQITQSVGINCADVQATVEPRGGPSIVVNIPTPGDPNAANGVTLRGLNILGRVDNTTKGPGKGIQILSAGVVVIDRVGVSNFQQQGILDSRTLARNGAMFITSSNIRYNGGAGIVSAQTPNGFSSQMVIEDTNSQYNSFGVAVAANNLVRINNSNFNFNNYGLETDPSANMIVDRSVVSFNTIALLASNGSTITISDTDVNFNATGISGNVISYGNNRISNSAGNAPGSTRPLQ